MTTAYPELRQELEAILSSDFGLRASVDHASGQVTIVMDDIANAILPAIDRFLVEKVLKIGEEQEASLKKRRVRLEPLRREAFNAGWKAHKKFVGARRLDAFIAHAAFDEWLKEREETK